jgi:hypothetical protein
MATTTNYSWSTPDDTALVKDGAAAIRTLGSSADTTVKALNPGTTAGDIDYYTTSTAKARLAIGTAGQVLRVNSGATAPEWGLVSGGLTYITGASFSAAATVSFASGVFTSSFQNYLVQINFTASSTGQNLSLRVNNAGTPRTAANYYGSKLHNVTATSTSGGTSHNAAALNTTYPWTTYTIYVGDPVTAGTKTSWHLSGFGFPDGGGAGAGTVSSACYYDVAEANDGLTFVVGGTMTGNYKVYGLANS